MATAADLIGRTATVRFGANDQTVTITAVNRWEKGDQIRDYIEIEQKSFIIGKVYIAVAGDERGKVIMDTAWGKVCANYDIHANSGAKQHAVREMLEILFAAPAEDAPVKPASAAPAEKPIMIPLGRLQGTVAAAPGVRVAMMVNTQPGPIEYACYRQRMTGTIENISRDFIGHTITVRLDEKHPRVGTHVQFPSFGDHLTALPEGE